MAEKVRAVKPVTEDKLQGKEVLAYINYGEGATYESPKWTLIGGQTKADFSMSADSIDASNKSSGGWGETYAGVRTTELSLEIVIPKQDVGYAALKDAFVKGEAVDICRYASDGSAERNWYNITELSDETPHDDMATASITLGGLGQPKFYHQLKSVQEVGTVSTASSIS